MPERPADAEMTGLEAALLTLKPAPAGIGRDRLMFEAGRRSARGRLWPCATAALALVSAALGATLVLRPAPPPVERVVYKERPAAPPTVAAPEPPDASPAPAADYFRLREQLLSRGLDGLPPPPVPPATPPALDRFLSGAEYGSF